MSQSQNNERLQDVRPDEMMGQKAFAKVVQSLIGRMHTITIGVVTAVNNDTCSIEPLTMMIDGANNSYSFGVVTNVPFLRLQGGANGIICNPKVGDIGLVAFAERDTSMVKRNKVKSPPNTKRQYDLNDAIYLGGILNSTPTQYIEFLDSGMNIKTTGDININGMTIKPDGTIVMKNGVVVDTHIHSQGSDSRGDAEQDTGVPHG